MGILDAGVGIANLVMQADQYDYQQRLQQDIFAREDSAMQRRVADLRAAGLSPVLAAGQGAAAGPVVSTTAPQVDRGSADVVESAMALMQNKENIAKTSSERELNEIQAARAAADIGKIDFEKEKLKADTYNSYLTGQQIAQDVRLMQESGMRSKPSWLGGMVQDVGGVYESARSKLEAKLRARQAEILETLRQTGGDLKPGETRLIKK